MLVNLPSVSHILKNNVTHLHPQSSFPNMGPSYLYRSHQSELPHLPCCLQIIYIHIKSYQHLLVQSSTYSMFIDSPLNKRHNFPWQAHTPPGCEGQSKCGHLPCFCLTCCPWLLVSNPRMSASTPFCFIKTCSEAIHGKTKKDQ